MDHQPSAKSVSTPITVDFLRNRIRHDRDAGDLRPLADYLAVFSAEETMVAQAYFSVCQESTPPPGSRDATELNRSTRTSMLAATVGGRATPAPGSSSADQVGPYRLIKELGRGGQGAVHLAEDTRLGRRVALKVLTGVGSLTEANLRRFHREAELASKLDHPGICAVYDFGAFEGVPYIAMRFVEGETLAKRISNAKQPEVAVGASEHIAIEDDEVPKSSITLTEAAGTANVRTGEVIRIMERASRAIHAAHEAGVIHRDLKPGNIMVDASGEPVVLDFGLARDLEGDGVSLTKSGDFLGTPAYMSPEQIASGHIHLDRRSDVYSLGVTLYECLTLRRPFDAPTREALYQAILSKEPPDARRLNKSVSPDLKVVIETALNKDRDKRYVTAEAFADDLKRVLELKPIRAKPISAFGRLTRWARRNPGIAISTAAAFLSLAIGLVATLIQKSVADEHRVQAESKGAEAQANLEDWERLADGRVLADLVDEAGRQLWPATPDRVPLMEAWLARARDLGSRLQAHKAALVPLHVRARPFDDAAKQRDREAHAAEHGQIEALSGEIDAMKAELAKGGPDGQPVGADQRKVIEARIAAAGREKAELEARASKRVTWEFDKPADQLKHDELLALVRDLEVFLGPRQPDRATVKEMEERLEFARSAKKRTVDDYAAAWRDAIAAIAKAPCYRGLAIKEQVGLIPIGADPKSGLWEFAEIQTGEPVKRGADGSVEVDGLSGMVFVLVPGGTFWMGSQKEDAENHNFDPAARSEEGPIREVTLAPLLVSKFEMTQGQWERFTGKNPSQYRPGQLMGDDPVDLDHPVERVTWSEATEVLRRLGLVLPTEAQWEYFARAGTESPWWCGSDAPKLADAANLADQSLKSKPHAVNPVQIFDSWVDRYAGHAPVGSYKPNPFGLHDVLGNVWEWCQDGYERQAYRLEPQVGDGLRPVHASKLRVIRGSAWSFQSAHARSAFRGQVEPQVNTGSIGVRPVRQIQQ